ncbi:MAG TPA: lytic transglycosylase domain-containing protein [Verrucomicrobiae bacterium]|nr:lytic transglycosylase domain-containing protein [Verrucomicrobiae bacterium]
MLPGPPQPQPPPKLLKLPPWLLLVLVIGAVLYVWWWQARKEHRYDAFVREAAARYWADPALVKAMIWRESRFDPQARGRAGELGLMQLREPAAFEWAEAEHLRPFSHQWMLIPRDNVLAGTWYLQKILKRYARTDNPVPYALADYNAGRAHVLRWTKGPAATNSAAFLRNMDFPGTREYIASITRRRQHYQLEFKGK